MECNYLIAFSLESALLGHVDEVEKITSIVADEYVFELIVVYLMTCSSFGNSGGTGYDKSREGNGIRDSRQSLKPPIISCN